MPTYPTIPDVTARFIENANERVVEWRTVTDAELSSDLPDDASSPGLTDARRPS